MHIAPEGWSNILFVAGICTVIWIIYILKRRTTVIPGVVFTLLTLFTLFFFRDPQRVITPGDGLLLSPADGKVLGVTEYEFADGREARMLSIFLSPLNVHVNRSAVSGIVESVVYQPGKFFPAYKTEAAESNEMNVITIKCPGGTVVMRQVVGAAARRVVCNLEAGQQVTAGDRIGIMKFGSRMDLILPDNVEIKVKNGQAVKAGQTIIGEWLENH
ncbi:MAG: phosphatidylserine decarboxylase [FCB group bacterium]|nr:phosphatidylserine decarboxylase [FCB group bacterium]